MDGKKRRKSKSKRSTSTSTTGNTARSGDSKQSEGDHDLHKGENVSLPTPPKDVSLDAGRKKGSSKDASGEKGRIHKTASTDKSLVGVDQPQPTGSAVSKAASTGSPGGGGDSGEGKKSKKSRKRRRQEAALSLASTTGAEAKQPSAVSVETLPVGVNSSSSKKGKKSKAQKKAHNSSSGSDSKGNTVKDAGGKPQQSGASSASRESSGGGGGGGGGSGAGAGSGARRGAGAAGAGGPKLSDLQKRMRQKLEGAQFRMINETLYTSESGASLAKFKEEPDLFDVVRLPSFLYVRNVVL